MNNPAPVLVPLLFSIVAAGCAGTPRAVPARIPVLADLANEPTVSAPDESVRAAFDRRLDVDLGAALPQERVRVRADATADDRGRLLFGLGFTAGPETFALSFEGDFPAGEVLIGPLLQLGVSDDDTLVALSLNVKKEAEVEVEVDAESWSVYPFVQAGLGVAWLEKDNRGGDDDEAGLLLNAGFGFRVPIDDHMSFASTMLFNLVPGEIVDERFFFTWQVAQFEIAF